MGWQRKIGTPKRVMNSEYVFKHIEEISNLMLLDG